MDAICWENASNSVLEWSPDPEKILEREFKKKDFLAWPAGYLDRSRLAQERGLVQCAPVLAQAQAGRAQAHMRKLPRPKWWFIQFFFSHILRFVRGGWFTEIRHNLTDMCRLHMDRTTTCVHRHDPHILGWSHMIFDADQVRSMVTIASTSDANWEAYETPIWMQFELLDF